MGSINAPLSPLKSALNLKLSLSSIKGPKEVKIPEALELQHCDPGSHLVLQLFVCDA